MDLVATSFFLYHPFVSQIISAVRESSFILTSWDSGILATDVTERGTWVDLSSLEEAAGRDSSPTSKLLYPICPSTDASLIFKFFVSQAIDSLPTHGVFLPH